MTLEETIAAQAPWVQVWVAILTIVGIAVPLALLVWKSTRVAGIIALAAQFAAGFGVQYLFDRYGYVDLVALPHVIFWTPLVIYLVIKARAANVPVWPQRLLWLLIVVLTVSLLFDYGRVVRYFIP